MSDLLPTTRRIYGIIRAGSAGKTVLHLTANVIAIEL